MELLRVAGLLSILVFGAHAVCKDSSSLTAFEQVVLDKHNELRRLHDDTDDLCYGETGDDIYFFSQTWADEMAANKQMEHSASDSSNPIGENIAMAATTGTIAAKDAAYEFSTTEWYSEISYWDFSSSTENGGVTGHFTQVVWKSTQQVNCGYTTFYDDPFNRYYVVCQYYPAGNFEGRYAAQVGALASDGNDSNDTDDDDESSDDSDSSSDNSSDDSNDSDDSSNYSNDWTPTPTERGSYWNKNTMIQYDLEGYPLQIKTDSQIPSSDEIRIVFYTEAERILGGVRVKFTDPPQYWIGWCSSVWTEFVLPEKEDLSEERIWTISKNNITYSDVLGWMTLSCDGEEIVKYEYAVLHPSTTWELCLQCQTKWKGDVVKMMFWVQDTASHEYRAVLDAVGPSSCEPIYTAKKTIKPWEQQSITSPNYPDNYPENFYCISVIYAEAGQQVQLTFPVFSLKAHVGCTTPPGQCRDYVEIRNGDSFDSPLKGMYCGRSSPGTVTSTNGALWVRFKSQRNSGRNSGFLADFKAVDSEDSSDSGGDDDGDYSSSSSSCEPQYYATQGNPHIITSPEYPEAYPECQNDCTSVIYPLDGEQVVLEFTYFDLEYHGCCRYDYVQVRDGDSASSPLIGQYCGNTLPDSITSTRNALYVDFRSDDSYRGSYGGFSATYESVPGDSISSCEPQYYATYGNTHSITSPDYPNEYPNNQDDCTSVIYAENEEQLIYLEFKNFDLEWHSSCARDYVEVRDGVSASSPLIGKYCGGGSSSILDSISSTSSSSPPDSITSSSYALRVEFHSKNSQNYRGTKNGFYATYEAVYRDTTYDNPACEPQKYATQGNPHIITSPDYPNEYPNNQNDCTSVIYAEDVEQVVLEFTVFDMQECWSDSISCECDYVEVRDGDSASSPLIGKYCSDTESPGRIASTDNALYVNFHSDSDDMYPARFHNGFYALYEAVVNVRQGSCDPQYYATQGYPHIITSPDYPNEYPNSLNYCTSVIYAEDGEQVVLEFTHFDLEYHPSCAYDYVEVRDGDSASSTLIGKYCGSTSPGSITSTSNALYVDFHSDSSVTEGGFYATYEARSSVV